MTSTPSPLHLKAFDGVGLHLGTGRQKSSASVACLAGVARLCVRNLTLVMGGQRCSHPSARLAPLPGRMLWTGLDSEPGTREFESDPNLRVHPKFGQRGERHPLEVDWKD